jgi:ornithine cyclodeaminase
MNPIPNLNIVPFVSVDNMMKLVMKIGIEEVIKQLVTYLEEDFRRWELFDKTPRIGSHSADGVIGKKPLPALTSSPRSPPTKRMPRS